ncbi:MAG TPA: TonB-dependent receptor [Kofleriaceae bacterium]|nr:TonB-dependent receptor [Kofleriaceae bacterium]
MSRALLVALALVLAAAAAHAQPANDIEVPAVVIDNGDSAAGPAADEALDLANIVQSAAKGVTTVQEAPAIVTVVTADEIKDRQFQDLGALLDTVPGWTDVSIYHSNFDTPLVRGQVQAVQFLHDGLSLFDPFVNVPSINYTQPMELIKRVEMITGPGGVLWGSNSLLGIMNVITKDAEDVEGVEMGATLGDGNGDRRYARAYVMAGKSDLVGGALKVFAHASVQTDQGPAFENPILYFHDPLPQPNSPNQYGPLATTQEPQSLVVTLDGKLTYDKLQLRVFAPFGSMYKPMGFSGEPVRDNCTVTPPGAMPNPALGQVPNDPTCASNTNRSDQFDRYAVAEYRTRFAGDQAGITARVYAQQFVRNFEPLQVLAPSLLAPGGLSFDADLTSYRAGGAIDGDVELARSLRVLYGGEAFNEWEPGSNATFSAPTDLTRLPILCPRIWDPTKGEPVPVPGCSIPFAYSADRTVFGAYLDPQWRPNKQLIFDVGARLQAAPSSLGSLSYPLDATFAGTIVWNFVTNWHLKLNFAQGFRPPVFNDTSSNGEAVQIAGKPDLSVEKSEAAQAELNARVFKGERRIRELSFRVDASYTKLQNLIQVESGSYENSGERGLTSVELLGKLYVQGGHRVELGYTYLYGVTSDEGVLVNLPQNWFNLATVFQLVEGKLSATTNLKVAGSAEDPNRLVEYRGNVTPTGMIVPCSATMPCVPAATDLVLDRLPPIAELSLGVTYLPRPKLAIRATVYDALAGHYYQPDAFFNYEPHLEYLPNPYAGLRAYLSALLQY